MITTTTTAQRLCPQPARSRRPGRTTVEREIRRERRFGVLATAGSALLTGAIAYAVTYAVRSGHTLP